MSKMPTHDGSEMIELYLDRLETWFELEGVTSEKDNLRHVFPFLPPAMFVEVKQAKVREHDLSYEQMKKVLKQAFAREGAARVRELTACHATVGGYYRREDAKEPGATAATCRARRHEPRPPNNPTTRHGENYSWFMNEPDVS